MCDCFTCTHKNMRERAAYYTGYVEACDWFLTWAKDNNIKEGSIGDDDLGGIVTQMRCNRDESEILRREMVEMSKQSHKTAQRAWADRNREKINQQAREYYARNREQVRAKAKERYRKKKEAQDEGN